MLINIQDIFKEYKKLNFTPNEELLTDLTMFVKGFNNYAIINDKPILTVEKHPWEDSPPIITLKWSSHYDENTIEIGTCDFSIGYINQDFNHVVIHDYPLEFIALDEDEKDNDIYHKTDFDQLNCHFNLFNNYDLIKGLK